jgi:hypothetical protein
VPDNVDVQTLADGPPRLQYADALVDLGAALRRAHRRADAREHLRQGLAAADAGAPRRSPAAPAPNSRLPAPARQRTPGAALTR